LNLGVPLGLGSGLVWGAADFLGGLQSRRLPALTVAFWSQVAGALALAAAIAVLGVRPIAAQVAWGIAAGVGGGLALVLFYRGLAEGTMSVVAPISACGAVIPVAAALLAGDQPGTVAAFGVLSAITGVILVSRVHPRRPGPDGRPRPGPEGRGDPDVKGASDHGPGEARSSGPGEASDPGPVGGSDPGQGEGSDAGSDGRRPSGRGGGSGQSGRALAMALGAALGFGLFYVFVDAGTAVPGGSPLSVVAGARASSLVVLSAIAAVGWRSGLRWPGRRLGPVALVGIGDTGANLLFGYAAITGNLAVVGVLGSLYPVATVILARWLLGERLSTGQNAGVVLALTGVGLLAAA
jgi:drug/metabolite transporter (DMT)-like permease